jgi:DNA-binding NarL/FixJ family response regulator
MNTTSIIIADDHAIFRDGFKMLLKKQNKVKLVAEAANGKELLEKVKEYQPDVVITDIKMPVMDGIAACHALRRDFPSVKIIALSMFNDDHLVIEMLEAGANGYLLKNTNKSELLLAICTVKEGGSYYCDATSEKLSFKIAGIQQRGNRSKPAKLTETEKEIMRLICQQYSNKEIALAVKLSVRTVESYRIKIQLKTGAKNTAGIVIYSIRHQIFQL